jgi:hypothetical protein
MEMILPGMVVLASLEVITESYDQKYVSLVDIRVAWCLDVLELRLTDTEVESHSQPSQP